MYMSSFHQQKQSKRLSKEFESPIYWNEYKTKSEIKDTTKGLLYFFKWNFAGLNRLFVVIYSNQDNDAKIYKGQGYYFPNGVVNSFNVVINGKLFYHWPIDSDITQYHEIRKSARGKGEDFITRCLLDYGYVKNYYRLILVDFSRGKWFDTDLKAIQKMQLIQQLKNLDNNDNTTDAWNTFVLQKLSQGRCSQSRKMITFVILNENMDDLL